MTQAFLISVSCASLTNCTAVGYDTPDAGGEQLLAERWDGSRWAIQAVPIPAGATESELYAVSCAAPTSCTAVGQYYPASGPSPALLAEHWDGTGWTLQRAPLPALASGGQLGGVSCPTTSGCVAVGSYSEINQNTGLLAERWNGSKWTLQILPIPAGGYFLLLSVSCQQSGQCTAVGGALNASQQWQALVERTNGTSWAIQKDAAPARTLLFGVSCPSAQSCTAAGENLSTTGMASRTGLAENWDGTRWTRQPTPVPRKTTTGAILSGVSCAGALYCTAVGDYAPHGMPLADHEG